VAAETAALASSVALARLLPPAAFGHAAVPLTVVALALIMGPLGVTAHLVQRSSVEVVHREGAAFLSVVTGAALTTATLVFAFLAGTRLFGSTTTHLLEFAAPAWLVAGLGAVSQATLQRELRFARIALIESVSALGGASVAIVLATLGVDAEALVAGGLVTLTLAASLAVASSRPAFPRPSRRGVAEVGGFATRVSLSSLVYSAFSNVDYAILAARLSPAQVGWYYRAYQLGVDYQSKLSQIMLRVSFPVYSRTETLEDIRRLRMRIVRVHATVLVPILAGFVAVAPLAIPWIFGAAWQPSVVPAQIMAIAGAANVLTTGTGNLMVAIGRPGVLLVWSVCELALYGVLVFVLAPHGIRAVAIGVACFGVGSVLVNQLALLRPFVGVATRDFALEILPGLVAGAAVLGASTGLRELLEAAGPAIPLRLVLLVGLGVVVYVLVLRALFRDVWQDLLSLVRRLRREAPAAS